MMKFRAWERAELKTAVLYWEGLCELTVESTILFDCPNISFGRFRCLPSSENWSRENQTGDNPIIVFPRTAVEIHQADRYPVVATPIHCMFYNANQSYGRDMIDPRGDACELLAVSPTLISEMFCSLGALRQDDLRTPFDFSHSPCSPDVYFAQRALFRVVENLEADTLFIEEQVFRLLPKLLNAALRFHDPFGRRAVPEHTCFQRDHVEAAKDHIARNYKSHLSVQQIADYVECSAFHLCRIFKKISGLTIHQFLTQFRLRNALEQITETKDSLTQVALDLGFSSHSHFTNAFRKNFGVSPNAVRLSPFASIRHLLRS